MVFISVIINIIYTLLKYNKATGLNLLNEGQKNRFKKIDLEKYGYLADRIITISDEKVKRRYEL